MMFMVVAASLGISFWSRWWLWYNRDDEVVGCGFDNDDLGGTSSGDGFEEAVVLWHELGNYGVSNGSGG